MAALVNAALSFSSFATASSTARNCAYIASSPGSGDTSLRIAGNTSTNFSGTTHFTSAAPFGPGYSGIFDQSATLTLPSNLLRGYALIFVNTSWTAFLSVGSSLWNTRGKTHPWRV